MMNFGVEPIPAGRGESRRRWLRPLVQTLLILTAIMLPVILMAYPNSPPNGITGAPGEGNCAGCHGPNTAGSGVTASFPSSVLTYTPGGPAIPLTVAIAAGSGRAGFELSSRVQNDNSQAGTLTAGAGSAVSTSGSIQYIAQSSPADSFSFTWTPPATNVGNVVIYLAGARGFSGVSYTNSYTLAPAGTTTPETISVSSSTLAFSYSGTAPATQTVQVTSSGAAIPFTTSVSTTSGGNWLSATPPAGNTPLGVTVTANPAGLAVGTYTGTVSVASTGATNSPQTVSVTFDVTVAGPMPLPTIASTPASLKFAAATNTTPVAPQSLMIASSDSSAQMLAATVSTATGGSWLSVSPATGSTPLTLSVMAAPAGLANGTYMGTVTLTGAGAANSPLMVPVTLTVGPATPPSVGPLHFSFRVIDSQSGGSNSVLLDGSGSVDSAGKITGGGSFTIYSTGTSAGEDSTRNDVRSHRGHHTVATGHWSATSVNSFTPPSSGTTGGVLEISVDITTTGGTAQTGTMRIANTGTDTGVKLVIDGGATFMPTGTGSVSIRTGSTTSGGGGDDGPGEDSVGRRGHDN